MIKELPSAKVIKHSIAQNTGIELITLQTRMPRIILAEFNTHGAIAKNARSTRAVPTKKLIEEVRTNPYIPSKWGYNNPGMQSKEWVTDPKEIAELEAQWIADANEAANRAEWYLNRDKPIHKQWAGRQLEPFMWVDSVITATDWTNFQTLRNHEDAQPEFHQLAEAIKTVIGRSIPNVLKPGEWHLPYVNEDDYQNCFEFLSGRDYFHNKKISNKEDLSSLLTRHLSVARCARVSYTPFDGNGSVEKELERYDNLVTSKPVHSSPTEHQATPDIYLTEDDIEYCSGYGPLGWQYPEEHGRFMGWRQFRHQIPGNTVWDKHHEKYPYFKLEQSS